MSRSKMVSIVAALILLIGLGVAWVFRARPLRPLVVQPRTIVLPADGSYHRAFRVTLSGGKPLAGELEVIGLPAQVVMGADGSASIQLQSPSMPGQRTIRVERTGYKRAVVAVTFATDSSDHFEDGTPEFLRLHTASDRAAFRGWFTALADFAAALPADQLPKEIGDCAALLRWCYRNALHAHDEAWLDATHLSALPTLHSVQQYAWPNTPLGPNLFRVRAGTYAAGDAGDGAYAQFADAHALWQHNSFLVSRELRAALPGDLLFYRQLEQNSPFHSMILTGSSAQWAVYHTGPIGRGPGEVRRVLVDDLLHHPDRRWRPNVDNENFLGVYRWNILRQDRR